MNFTMKQSKVLGLPSSFQSKTFKFPEIFDMGWHLQTCRIAGREYSTEGVKTGEVKPVLA